MRNSIVLVFIILFLLMSTEAMAKEIHTDELMDLANFVVEQEAAIETWTVTIKETIDQKQLPQILKKLHENKNITMTEDENSIKYQVNDPQKNESFVELYNVVIPKTENQRAELIVVLEGDSWDKNVRHTYQLRINEILNEWFTNSKQIFSWLEFSDDGIIDRNVFINELIAEFNLQDIITQSDNISTNRKMIYGYTPVWSQKVRMQSISVNLQIAMAMNTDGDTTYTIGTPILINEY